MADKKPAAKKAPTKSLSRLRDTSKGPIDHVRIYPAKNGAGKQAFRTTIHRQHPKAVADQMANTGKYMPEPAPEETVHEDGQDMLDHVGRAYGIQPDDEAAEGEGAAGEQDED